MYLDKDPQVPVDGGTNSNGTQVGTAYDGTNFANLPFRADLVVYAKNGYREYRTSNGSNGWSSATSAFGLYAESGTTREIAIPWSAIGGRPSSFNFFTYVTSSTGFVYGQTPTENGSGNIGTSARYSRYYTVSTTTVGSSTPAFSRNSYVFNSASDVTSFGPINCYDFTMNSSGRFLSRTGNVSGNWTISGNLVVGNGIIYLGSGGASYGTTSVSGNLNLLGGSFDMDNTTGAVSITGNVTIASGASLKLSSVLGGDLSLNGNWSNSGTFTSNSRQVTFSGSTAQTLTGNSTFDYLKLNNVSGLTLQVSSAVTVNTNLDLTSGKLTLGTNNLTLGSSCSTSNSSTSNYIVLNSTGKVIVNGVSSARLVPFGTTAAYAPITLSASSATNYTTSVTSTLPCTPADATKLVNLAWGVDGANAPSSVTFQWNASNQAASFVAGNSCELGSYSSACPYTTTALSAASGSGPYTLTASTGLLSGNIVYAIGNQSALVSVSPVLSSATLGVDLTTIYGSTSTGVSFTASGTNLTGNITATAQSGFEVSTDNSSYSSSVSVAGGSLVYVRFSSAQSAGTYNGAIAAVLSGGGAASSVNVLTSASGNSVTQKDLTISGLTANAKVYDGSTSATASGTPALVGVVGSDVVTLGGTGTYTFASANVGIGISVSTSGFTLSGTNSGNYSLTQPTLSGEITVKSITLTANDVTKYAGTVLTSGAGSTAFSSSGLVGSETIGSVSMTYGTAGAATGDGNTIGVYTGQAQLRIIQ